MSLFIGVDLGFMIVVFLFDSRSSNEHMQLIKIRLDPKILIPLVVLFFEIIERQFSIIRHDEVIEDLNQAWRKRGRPK